jgi:hypothetical protein
MPVNSTHPLYDANLTAWSRCRDCYNGEDAVKSRGQSYLPKVDPTQTDEEYKAYQRRAMYYEAMGRTVDGFVGAISRKPHTIKLPPELDHLLVHTTADGTGLAEFIKRQTAETLIVARGLLLVDFDDKNQRPYLSIYTAESVINWADDWAVLTETVYELKRGDPFKQEAISQIRVLSMDGGFYTVTLWRYLPVAGSQSGEMAWQVYGQTVPTIRGQPIREMPWFWFSSMGQSSLISKPQLLGLANTSLSHYRTSADLEHGRHFTALPTLYLTGVSGDEPVRVGSGAVIKINNPQGRAGYAEFTGQGLGSLENALASKEAQMAMLGAAVFAATKKGVEAAETAKIRTAGENSLLMGVVSSVEETLTAALEFAAVWAGAVAGAVSVKINRDFIDQDLNPQTIVGMVQAYQAGMMSLEAFLYCLSQAEMLPPETDIEAEAAKLRKDGPPKPPAPAIMPGQQTPAEPASKKPDPARAA